MKVKRAHYYIVDSTSVKDIFVYRKSFMSRSKAQEIIDAYLPPELVLSIKQGDWVRLKQLPWKKASFLKYIPWEVRRPKVRASINNRKKRKRLLGSKIITHKFKSLWDKLPVQDKARKAALLKDRDKIRNIILK